MIELLNERQINALGGIRSAKNEKADIAHHTAQELYLCIPVVSLFSLRNHSALCEKTMRTQLNTNPKLAGMSISVHSISGNWEGKVQLSFASNIQK